MGVVEPFKLNILRMESNEIQIQFKKITTSNSPYVLFVWNLAK